MEDKTMKKYIKPTERIAELELDTFLLQGSKDPAQTHSYTGDEAEYVKAEHNNLWDNEW